MTNKVLHTDEEIISAFVVSLSLEVSINFMSGNVDNIDFLKGQHDYI